MASPPIHHVSCNLYTYHDEKQYGGHIHGYVWNEFLWKKKVSYFKILVVVRSIFFQTFRAMHIICIMSLYIFGIICRLHRFSNTATWCVVPSQGIRWSLSYRRYNVWYIDPLVCGVTSATFWPETEIRRLTLQTRDGGKPLYRKS